MVGPAEFRDLVSGRRRGVKATALRGLLRFAEIPYTLAVRYRNHRYDRRRTAIHHVSVPVISVGNLTLGGTGKTPMVKWLARRLQELGSSVALVSRGYGADAHNLNDEARELAQALPNVPHLQNSNRVVAARRAIDEFAPTVLLLDDGFQHRRLARDLDIVLLDALEPFGFDHVFPRGTLREPVTSLKRADVVCLSRADAIAPEDRELIRRHVAELAPKAAWCELAHIATTLVNSNGATQPLESLAGKRVAAFCAIGNPAGFWHTLSTMACDICDWQAFPDHHVFTSVELDLIYCDALASDAQMVVCTQKDLVKASYEKLGEVPLWALAIDMQFLAGKEALEQILTQIVRKN